MRRVYALRGGRAASAADDLRSNPEYGGKIDDKKNRYIGFDISGQGNNRSF